MPFLRITALTICGFSKCKLKEVHIAATPTVLLYKQQEQYSCSNIEECQPRLKKGNLELLGSKHHNSTWSCKATVDQSFILTMIQHSILVGTSCWNSCFMPMFMASMTMTIHHDMCRHENLDN